MSLLRFFIHTLCFPESRALGFPRMGLGIEQRASRLHGYWNAHLDRCRRIQERWSQDEDILSGIPQEEERQLLVLGAGRLLDLNVRDLGRRFRRLRLLDADPLCRPYWNRSAEMNPGLQIDGEIVEFSGVLQEWRKLLEDSNLSTWDNALESIRRVVDRPNSVHASPFAQGGARPSAALSLNVLSQIPIVWQDCVERVLSKRFSARVVRRREHEWLQAILPGAEHLVRSHLADLAGAGPASILLITDLQYAQYSGPRLYSLDRIEPAPVRWARAGYDLDQGGSWSENRATAPIKKKQRKGSAVTTCEVTDALYGVDLETQESRSRLVPGYRSRYVDSWLWHIQPQGIEDKSKGMVHRVGAFVFVKEQPASRKDVDYCLADEELSANP